jgi:hypothetical protein
MFAELAILYLLLRNQGWAFDDNLSLELARQYGLGWHWLGLNLFGHWEPAHRAAFSLLLHEMPVDYRWALLTMLALVGVSMYLLSRIVRVLIDSTWMPAVAAAYFGLSVLLIAPLEWTSSGLEAFPTIAFDLLCFWSYLEYRERPAARWIAVSAGAIFASLMFYEKATYVPFYILLFRVLILSDDLHPRAVWAGLWRERRIWASYIVVLIAYALVRELTGAGSIASGGPVSLSQWLAFFRIFWLQSLPPRLLGITVAASGLSGLQVAAVVVAQVITVTVIVVSVIRRRSAWRVWLVFFICVIATAILVGEARVGDIGPGSANDPRYLFDFAWLVPILVALAFTGPRGSIDRADTHHPPSGGRRSALVLAGSVALGVYLGASVATAAHMRSQWQGGAARQWEQNVERGLVEATRESPHALVVNGNVPWFIVEAAFSPYNQLSVILPLYGPPIQIDGPLGGPLYSVAPSGSLVRARIGPALAHYGRLGAACAPPSGAARQIDERLSLPAGATAGPYYLVTSYSAAGSTQLPVYIDDPIRDGGDRPHALPRFGREHHLARFRHPAADPRRHPRSQPGVPALVERRPARAVRVAASRATPGARPGRGRPTGPESGWGCRSR